MRVKFILSMPSAGSWDGKWSGSEKKYFVIKNLSPKTVAKLENYYSYNFGDGWRAGVSIEKDIKGRHGKSDGMCGYDWMIASILSWGEIKT